MRFQKSWTETLDEIQTELAARDADPLRKNVEALVRGMEAISTHSLLDLLGLPNTTGNARRIARTMRSLGGFVPIQSRRLIPGGWHDTVTRGWARPIRELRNSSPTMKPASASRYDLGGRI